MKVILRLEKVDKHWLRGNSNSLIFISDVVETVTFETDLVKILRRDQDFIINSETWSSGLRLRNLYILPKLKKKIPSSLLTSIFLIFWNFSDVFWLFPTCKYNKQKSLNDRNFNKPFLCNIQSLETWNIRVRDSQKWVSRPRPSLETHHWFIFCTAYFTKWQMRLPFYT